MKSCCETQTRMKFLCFADTMFCSILKKLFSLSGTSLTKQVSFFGLISSLVLATLCYSFCHCFGKGHVTFHFLAKILILLTPSDLISQKCYSKTREERVTIGAASLWGSGGSRNPWWGKYGGFLQPLSWYACKTVSPHFWPAGLMRIVLPVLERSQPAWKIVCWSQITWRCMTTYFCFFLPLSSSCFISFHDTHCTSVNYFAWCLSDQFIYLHLEEGP